jgi:hypothetical protein
MERKIFSGNHAHYIHLQYNTLEVGSFEKMAPCRRQGLDSFRNYTIVVCFKKFIPEAQCLPTCDSKDFVP